MHHAPSAARGPASGGQRVYLGTRTGVYTARFDPVKGRLFDLTLAAEAPQSTFLALHPNRPFLYAVGARMGGAADPAAGGVVRAFARDDRTGQLLLLNEAASGGLGPCHLAADRAGTCLVVANYRSGSVAALPLRGDGRVGAPATVMQHRGAGPNPRRQEGPHAHSVTFDPAERFVLAADLGTDQLLVYRFGSGGALTPNDPPAVSLAPGSGPRHAAFDPAGRRLYVINELANTVTVFRYDAARGMPAAFQTVSTLPAGYADDGTAAEVRVHPNGRWLYGSNRGHGSIAVFAVDPVDGALVLAAIEPCGGHWPRHFAIAPGGDWLLAAHERSDTLAVFALDPAGGRLTPVGEPVRVPAPVCVLFAPA